MRWIIYLVLLLTLISPALAGDWGTFKKDASHSGFTTDTVSPPLVLKWTASLREDTDSSPVVVGDTVYIGSNYGIHALDVNSGRELWRNKTNGFVRTAPAVADGVVYVASEDKRFYAFDAKTGAVKWIYPNSTSVFSSPPVVVNNLVYAGAKDGTLYALDTGTGEPVWSELSGRSIESSPAIVDGVVYFGNDKGTILAVDASSGKEKWHYDTSISEIKSAPAVAYGTVFIGSNDGRLYALNATRGTVKWTYSTGGNIEASPSVKDGVVYVGSKDTGFYAIDAETGKLKWRYQAAGFIDASSAISNNAIYFGSKNNFIYGLDANTGTLLWRNMTGSRDKDDITSPAISGNMLYAVTHSGTVYAYSSGVQATPTRSVTPTEGGIAVTTSTPAASPAVTPAGTQKTPGFEYAGLVLLITVLIRRRRGPD